MGWLVAVRAGVRDFWVDSRLVALEDIAVTGSELSQGSPGRPGESDLSRAHLRGCCPKDFRGFLTGQGVGDFCGVQFLEALSVCCVRYGEVIVVNQGGDISLVSGFEGVFHGSRCICLV